MSVHVPRLWERRCPERTADGLRRKNLDLCLIFGIPSWLMAVAATKACSRFTGTCRELSPPSSPFPPLSFFAFWGFPEWNTQDHPFLSMVCPWTITFSPFLFLSFSLSPLFTFFLGCPWMLSSWLGALPFWCVLGRLCRSWKHLCFLLSFPLFSSSPSPPLSLRAACLQAN